MHPNELREFFSHQKPVIGMVHLAALPGSPRASGGMAAVLERALDDAKALADNGAAGVMLENFGDTPYYPDHVPAETVASMTVAAAAVRQAISLPVGVNVLRNDGYAAMSIAAAVGAAFIRINVLAGAMVTDQGILESEAHRVLRLRTILSAAVKIFADVDVKHATSLDKRRVEAAATELVERCGADALICTGAMTGAPIDLDQLRRLRKALPDVALIAGSGVTAHSAAEIFKFADAAIVGTALKYDGRVGEKVDPRRVLQLMAAIKP